MPGNLQASSFQVSTDALPERDRIAFWREEFGRKVARYEFEPLDGSRFHGRMKLRQASGLRLVSLHHSPMRVLRTPQLIADGDDDLVLQITMTGNVSAQLGRELNVDPGSAVLCSNADSGTFISPSADSRCTLLVLSRQNLRPMLGDFDAAMLRHVSAATPALKLLKSYIGIFGEDELTPELEQMAVDHVYDLVAVTLGARPDAAETAECRGMRPARLRAAKAYVMRNLGSHDLSPGSVAAHLGITTRYIHMLFETERVSFSKYVLEQRLLRARRMLGNPRCAGLTITQISLDAGFGDLSAFNRNVRRRFGRTPSELRNAEAIAASIRLQR
jgi:AraC-like DNA-binding protein